MIGNGRVRAIEEYINVCESKGKNILYSDIIYKKNEYELFDKWFKESLEPFRLFEGDYSYSVLLDQSNYQYDWVDENKINHPTYGDGHCYDQLFNDYLEKNFPELYSRLEFDSENGMFCVNCENKLDAEEVSYELSTLYKDENKMIDLIKETKNIYNYSFNINI